MVTTVKVIAQQFRVIDVGGRSKVDLYEYISLENKSNRTLYPRFELYRGTSKIGSVDIPGIGSGSSKFYVVKIPDVEVPSLDNGYASETLNAVVTFYGDSGRTQFYEQGKYSIKVYWVDEYSWTPTYMRKDDFEDGTSQGWESIPSGKIEVVDQGILGQHAIRMTDVSDSTFRERSSYMYKKIQDGTAGEYVYYIIVRCKNTGSETHRFILQDFHEPVYYHYASVPAGKIVSLGLVLQLYQQGNLYYVGARIIPDSPDLIFDEIVWLWRSP